MPTGPIFIDFDITYTPFEKGTHITFSNPHLPDLTQIITVDVDETEARRLVKERILDRVERDYASRF